MDGTKNIIEAYYAVRLITALPLACLGRREVGLVGYALRMA